MSYVTSIVNFEAFFIPKEQRFATIMKDIKIAVDEGSNTIIGLLLADGFLFFDNDMAKLLLAIEKESRNLGVKNLVLVPGIVPNIDVPLYDDVIKNFNYNLHLSYLSYKNRKHLLKPWNPNAEKFLFLGGVPDRPNRINLLEKFYKANMLKDSVWTFFKPWTTEQATWCRNALELYSDSDYNKFLDECENSIDDMYINSKEYGTHTNFNYNKSEWFKDPAWIDPSIFQNTLFSVVSEGISYRGHSSNFLTEKTWRVFAQRHPYILAANNEMLQYVKDLGFKTFNESSNLDQIVTDTRKFLEIKPNVAEDVEYNYNLFFKLGEENSQVLEELKLKYNINQEDIDKWFNKTGFPHLIRTAND